MGKIKNNNTVKCQTWMSLKTELKETDLTLALQFLQLPFEEMECERIHPVGHQEGKNVKENLGVK